MQESNDTTVMMTVKLLMAFGHVYQVRTGMDDDTVERYAEIYRTRGADGLPAVQVAALSEGGEYVTDGHHRIKAASRAGLELLPCPFCGSQVHFCADSAHPADHSFRCSGCGAVVRFVFPSITKTLVQKWNTRK